jgi:hypothetical protein
MCLNGAVVPPISRRLIGFPHGSLFPLHVIGLIKCLRLRLMEHQCGVCNSNGSFNFTNIGHHYEACMLVLRVILAVVKAQNIIGLLRLVLRASRFRGKRT